MHDTILADGDLSFAHYLKGKSVVAVGPARTLLGGGLGAFIDSFDVVVRFNEAWELFPAPPRLARDIGSRTDVFYCNQVVLRTRLVDRPHELRRYFTLSAPGGARYVVCTNNSLCFTSTGSAAEPCPALDRGVLADLCQALAMAGATTQVRVVYAASHVLHDWLEGHWGRTGFVALFDLLSFDVQRLHVTGMTLYHGGGHLLAPASAELHPLKNRDGSWASPPSGYGHDSRLEREALRWLARGCPRLSVDDELGRLLR